MRVIMRLTAKPGKSEELKAVLARLIAPTRREPGCLGYLVLQNAADPCDFTLVEEWTTEAALDAHMATAHVQEALAKGVPLLAAEPDMRRYLIVG
jgi:quinol monooxygenase YgiN